MSSLPDTSLALPASRTTAVAVAEAIRTAIATGQFQPGQRLKEVELAEMLAVSRTPVREAIRMLQRDDLVEVVPNRGATVKPFRLAEFEEVCDLRAVLEGRAAYRAAQRLDRATIAELEASVRRSAEYLEHGELSNVIAEDRRFHGAIVEAAASARLAQMVAGVAELSLDYRLLLWHRRTAAERDAAIQAHRDVVAALSAGDGADAERAMREHLLDAGEFLTAHLRDGGGRNDGERDGDGS